MAATQSHSRASLLSGLRTGGVRSTSSPMAVPHTAAPGGSFNVPRFTSASHNMSHFPEEAEDELAELAQQSLHVNQRSDRYQAPKTAAVDGSFFQQQAPQGIPFIPQAYGGNNNVQAQMQMQMMQMEIMRLQAIQAQQYQAELVAQAQRQQQQASRRAFNPPATAGPMTTSFNMGVVGMPSMHKNSQEMLRSQYAGEDQVPMTAALGGRFGSRGVNGRSSPEDDLVAPPPTASRIISGGTSLGMASTPVTAAPSKSDSATSWRRNGNNNSVLSGNRQPSLKVTPPPVERSSPPTSNSVLKSRPRPLSFHVPPTSVPTVAVTDDSADETYSNGSSRSAESSPITPQSLSSNEPPLSPREVASKKLYEGLGIGRPVSPGVAVAPLPPVPAPVAMQRAVSAPVRQPIGPPSGELGQKNFATRVRKQAVNGLGALLAARERREVVEAY